MERHLKNYTFWNDLMIIFFCHKRRKFLNRHETLTQSGFQSGQKTSPLDIHNYIIWGRVSLLYPHWHQNTLTFEWTSLPTGWSSHLNLLCFLMLNSFYIFIHCTIPKFVFFNELSSWGKTESHLFDSLLGINYLF